MKSFPSPFIACFASSLGKQWKDDGKRNRERNGLQFFKLGGSMEENFFLQKLFTASQAIAKNSKELPLLQHNIHSPSLAICFVS